EFVLHSRARSTGQLHALIQELDQICRVVHPSGNNLDAYGHAIRNILLLACMEVEAHWKLLLCENAYAVQERNFNTKHYIKLLEPMKLDEFTVALNHYPWLEPICPFRRWAEPNTSRTLGWYSAYNDTKHDRERHFAEATLGRALTAVTACFV